MGLLRVYVDGWGNAYLPISINGVVEKWDLTVSTYWVNSSMLQVDLCWISQGDMCYGQGKYLDEQHALIKMGTSPLSSNMMLMLLGRSFIPGNLLNALMPTLCLLKLFLQLPRILQNQPFL